MSDTRAPTMAQIAERAGVALSTVSYVLSGKRAVSEPMRARVMDAIAELDYRPSGPARALASGASHTIALFLPSADWEFVPLQQTFVAGITQATSDRDYGLLLSTVATGPENIVRLVESHRADGVILMETVTDDGRVNRLQAAGLPFSMIGRTGDTTGLSFVDLDFGAAMVTALDHLVDLGHRCVAVLNFPPGQLQAGYTSALLTEAAFHAHCDELGIRGIHVACPYGFDDASAVCARLIADEPECTAVITTSWQFSALTAALRAARLSVPEDVSIVSIVASQYAEMLTPALTSIEWPAFQAGRLAADMLIERLRDARTPPQQLLIGGGLLTRDSTGPPPSRRRLAATRG